jgi:co-chaperonin GroES (HSP10)
MDTFKFNEHFMPISNGVVVKPLKNFKAGDTTESGIIIGAALPSSTPEADAATDKPESDRLGMEVVAVGPDCTKVQVGDLVMFSPSASYIVMELFGDEYYFSPDYNIMARVSVEAHELNEQMKQEKKERERAARVEAFKVSKLLKSTD